MNNFINYHLSIIYMINSFIIYVLLTLHVLLFILILFFLLTLLVVFLSSYGIIYYKSTY